VVEYTVVTETVRTLTAEPSVRLASSADSLAKVAPRPPGANAATSLSGWGRNLQADCELQKPESVAALARSALREGTIARGLGRSYGDAAINAGHRVIDMTGFDYYRSFDENTGVLICEAGVSLDSIIRTFLPRGWFPMITPGTKFVTVGGCIANDIHGKGHHSQGSFCNCVDAMTLLLATGEVVTTSRTENPELFWGTFGGMGLLGIVLTATLRLRRVETSFFRQKSIPARSLEEMLAALDEHEPQFPYSVATLDVFARGARLGSGVLTVGDHALRDELPQTMAAQPLPISGPPKIAVPFELPDLTLNPVTMRAVNAVILAIQGSAKPIGHYEGFFYPLDKIAHWNRGYGKRGFTQYQFVIPPTGALEHMRAILNAIFSSGQLPFLNILKRLGPASDGLLSFPREGYTFAIDFPIRQDTVALLQRLDAMVVEAGGRIYLGKDSYVTAQTLRAMYPRLDEWLALKAKYDPNNTFTSNLGRRTGLVASLGSLSPDSPGA
jgi:decaprenylphospho-beta-D-ribofuranose 2-oxidase